MKSIKDIVRKIFRKITDDNVITIVSGLPRSGTSMMMQMLEAGGMTVMTDNLRRADDDNPLGYYEIEKVKKIKEDPSWLDNCGGKAFKMVSALLYYLPKDKNYKVIFMKREMEEMLASQKKMLSRLGRVGTDVSDDKISEIFQNHLQEVEYWMKKQDNIDYIQVSYNDVINNPIKNVELVCRFLGGRLDKENMSQVVEKSLYRQRK